MSPPENCSLSGGWIGPGRHRGCCTGGWIGPGRRKAYFREKTVGVHHHSLLGSQSLQLPHVAKSDQAPSLMLLQLPELNDSCAW